MGTGEGKTCLNLTPLPSLLYASEIKPDYDTIIELYEEVNTGVDKPIEHTTTTQMRMILHFLPIF
jgi:hypothetical protein